MEILALERTLTQTDHARLARMIRSDAPAGVDTDRFTRVLESAQLVPSRAIPPAALRVALQRGVSAAMDRLAL